MAITTLVSTNLDIINLNKEKAPRTLADCARLVRSVGADAAVLSVAELQAFWLSIMADRSVAPASRLVASRYYADSIGAFGAGRGRGGDKDVPVAVSWASGGAPVDAEVVSEPEPEPTSGGV